MRRGIAIILFVSALGWSTSAALGQYYPNPYPYAAPPMYGPMPAQYVPPPMYGPMPAQYAQPYNPNPMPPGYYPPPGYFPPPQGPKIYVYGPLMDDDGPPPPNPALPRRTSTGVGTAKPVTFKGNPADKNAKANITQVQATAKDNPNIMRTQMTLEGCGPEGCSSCGSGCGSSCGLACGPSCSDECGPLYDFIPKDPVLLGHGHFIFDVGAYFFVPYVNPHGAYSTTNAAGITNGSDFSHTMDYGPRVTFGYIAHDGWGVRADYWYMHGNTDDATSNSNPAAAITSAMPAPFALTSPSGTLGKGIGVDQFQFSQRLDLNVADLEALKEFTFLDTTMLFGFGGRYSQLIQGYSATRSNPGGINAAGNAVELDHADASSESRFEGWGPTFSVELMQPLGCGFSIYGNMRASFLWGVERLDQNADSQLRSTTGGATTFVGTTNAATGYDRRVVSVGEAEVGVQYGRRVGTCYLFARAGLAIQRWWDVGNPTGMNGDLLFLGGTVTVGVTY